MAKFVSKFPELGFYCCGEYRQFRDGEYVSEKEDEIKVLENLADAQRADEPKEAPTKPKAPAKNKK